MKILTLPQLRQAYRYGCGAKALQTILAYYGIDSREDQIMKYAKTSESGTSIKDIVRVAKQFGLKTVSKEMTIEEVKKYLDKEIPVILALQAWTKKKDVNWKKNWSDGHYAVALGYTKDKIIFEDPAIFPRTFLYNDELEERWHDMDEAGKKYFHHGIAIFGKKPKFNANKLIHMD
jgi:predicted double-glycine peptidase